MKLTLMTSALVAVLGLAFASTSIHAQTTTTATPATTTEPSTPTTVPSKKAKKTQYSGTITAVDASSVTVKTTKDTLMLAIAPTTKYKGGTAITDFAVGDMVTGSYSKDATGAMTAASVHKKVKKAAATPAAQ